MKTIENYDNLTPCEFFEKPPVKRCLIRFIQKYGGGVNALTQVYTTNSASVTWTGNGTQASPLVATTVASTPNLQQVTTIGATTSVNMTINNASPQFRIEGTSTPSSLVLTSTSGNASIGLSNLQGLLTFNHDNGTVITINNAAGNTGRDLFLVRGLGVTTNTFHADGRVSGANATTNGDFVTYAQPLLKADYKGGQSPFTADSSTTVFNITHNLGAVPSYFTLTTTEPISSNHLNRTITFPDNNTLRITFALAPIIGEDANYVWIVYK